MTNGERPSIQEQLQNTRQEALGVRSEAVDIASELQRLLQMEGRLAQAEAKESADAARKGATFGGAAAVLAFVGAFFVFLTLMFALDTFLPLWAAALITTAVIFAIAGVLAMTAKKQFQRFSPVPKRFIRSVQEDIAWARTQLQSNSR